LRIDRFIGDIVEEHRTVAIEVSHMADDASGEQAARLLPTWGEDATVLERWLLPRFQRSLSLAQAVPSQPFQVDLAWQMGWRDLNLPLLIGVTVLAGLVPLFARRFALAYFEQRLARLDSDGEHYQMANFDALTGVANRHRLLDQLEITLLRARRDKTQFCLLFLDIDGFKTINDRLGHAAGDAILVGFSERLGSLLRGDEMLGRLGGDEFVIITGDNTGPDDMAVFVERIKHGSRQPLIYRKEAVPIAFSVRHACYPIDGRSTMALLDVADRRMYLEKQRHHERAATTG
jgi:diguanylate cyclase